MLCGSSFYLFSTLLDILKEHHQRPFAPPHIHQPFVVGTWTAEDGDCFASGHHHRHAVIAVAGFDSEGLNEELENGVQ